MHAHATLCVADIEVSVLDSALGFDSARFFLNLTTASEGLRVLEPDADGGSSSVLVEGLPIILGEVKFVDTAAAIDLLEGATVTLNAEASCPDGSRPQSPTVSVQTASGTATTVADFGAVDSDFSWTCAGDVASTYPFSVIVTAIDDDFLELVNESFTVQLMEESSTTLGDPATITVTIPRTPEEPRGYIGFESATLDVNEAAGSIGIVVCRTNASFAPASVRVLTDTDASGGTCCTFCVCVY